MCKGCFGWDSFPDHRERNVYREEDEYETPHKKSKKDKPKKRFKGCPSRDGKAHIFVWVKYIGKRETYGKFLGRGLGWGPRELVDAVWYKRVCVGCGHVNNSVGPYGWGSIPSEIYEVREGGLY